MVTMKIKSKETKQIIGVFTMKKIKILLLVIFMPIIIYSSQNTEQSFKLNEIIYSYGRFDPRVDIEILDLTTTDKFYYLTIFFDQGVLIAKNKIIFDIQINGTNNKNDFICTNISSQYYARGEYYWKKNDLFINFYKESFILLNGESNTDDNIYDNFRAELKIPRTATSIVFSGWVDDTKGKSDSKNKFYHTFKFTDYDVLLKSSLSKIKFDKNAPIISVISPEYDGKFLRTEDHIISIIGNVTDDNGIANIEVNDKKKPLDSKNNFLIKYRLDFGLNKINIKSEDIFGNISRKELFIYRDEIIEEELNFSDVDIPLKTNNDKINSVAIVIGIENYQYAPTVRNAFNDAEIIREYLIASFGLKRENIYFRYNEKATKGEFEKIFSENGWISNNSTQNSDIYIFYAGHGISDIKGSDAYLIPYDIDPNYASTGYSLNRLYTNLSKLKSKSVTVILDACFSGISRENEMILADSRPIRIEIKEGFIPSNISVFSASSNDEISSSYNEKMHGLFTYFFLKGLNKNADINNDNKITFGEMEEFLKSNVALQAKKMGRQQNPKLYSSDKSKILLEY